MTYDELLRAIYQALPETENKLAVERVRYVKSENKAHFSFLSDVLIGEKGFFAMKKVIASAFPQLKFSLRVASPSLAISFMQQPDTYAAPLNHFLVRNFPAVASWEVDMHWSPGNGKVYLDLPDEFSMHYLEKQNGRALLAQAIQDVFRLETDVVLRVSGDEEKRLNQLREERARQDRVAAERAERYEEIAAMEAKAKAQEKPKEDNNRICGRAIGEKPVDIKELRDDSGLVVIAGEVLNVETKSISGGEMELLTFMVTDYTSTIRCKMFLRYRPRRPKDDEAPPPPITDEERDMCRK